MSGLKSYSIVFCEAVVSGGIVTGCNNLLDVMQCWKYFWR